MHKQKEEERREETRCFNGVLEDEKLKEKAGWRQGRRDCTGNVYRKPDLLGSPVSEGTGCPEVWGEAQAATSLPGHPLAPSHQ